MERSCPCEVHDDEEEEDSQWDKKSLWEKTSGSRTERTHKSVSFPERSFKISGTPKSVASCFTVASLSLALCHAYDHSANEMAPPIFVAGTDSREKRQENKRTTLFFSTGVESNHVLSSVNTCCTALLMVCASSTYRLTFFQFLLGLVVRVFRTILATQRADEEPEDNSRIS